MATSRLLACVADRQINDVKPAQVKCW